MQIKLFNLSAVISEFNQLCGDQYLDDHDFGLACLSTGQLKKMDKHRRFLTAYEKSEDLNDVRNLHLAAQVHLQAFEHYYTKAENEFLAKSKKLPGFVRQKLEIYLRTVQKDIVDAQIIVADRMLDVLEAISLKNCLHGALSQEQFVCFHRHIQNYGKEMQIYRHDQLPWMKASLSLVSIQKKQGVTLIPKRFVEKNLVPNSVFFPFLFKEAHFRSTFFDDKSWLLVRLNHLSQASLSETTVNFATWKHIILECSAIKRELAVSDYQCLAWLPKGLWQYLFRSLNDFVSSWQEYSEKQHDLIEGRRVDAVVGYTKNIAGILEKGRDFNDTDYVSELEDVMKETKMMMRMVQDDERKMRLQTSHRQLRTLLQSAKKEQNQRRFQGETPSEMRNEEHKAEGLLMTVRFVNLLGLSDEQFEAFSENIANAVASLKHSESIKQRELSETVLSHIFVRYVEACLFVKKENVSLVHHQRLEKVAQMLLSSGNTSLSERVVSLKELDKQKYSATVYLIKCHSFLYSHRKNKAKPNGLSDFLAKRQRAIDFSGEDDRSSIIEASSTV